MKKIVQVLPAFVFGGAEMLVKEYLLHFDKTKYQIEVLLSGSHRNPMVENMLIENGVGITYLQELYKVPEFLPGKIRHIWRALRWRSELNRYFKKLKPDVVHCHLTANTLIPASRILKRLKTRMFYTIHTEPQRLLEKSATEVGCIAELVKKNDMHILALHEENAREIKRILDMECTVHIVNNGIDFDKFRSPEHTREEVLSSCGIPLDAFVVGHVGRFMEAKNHEFLIDVFEQIVKKNEKACLMLAGSGELQEAILEKVKNIGLEDKVFFLGNRTDVTDLLHAMDVFVFPSKWEGFPISLIETQVAGLRSILSDTVTRDVKLTNLVKYLSLELTATEWANYIIDLCSTFEQTYEEYGLEQYNIDVVVQHLYELYGVS